MTLEEQLEKWVAGESIHNDKECCPDFSCCQGKYKATEEERKLYFERPELREEMNITFLLASISANFPNHRIHVIDSSQQKMQ